MPVDADTATIEKPKMVVKSESVEFEKTQRGLETNPANTKKNQTSDNTKENAVSNSNTSEFSELQKPLDLSIPYKEPENVGLKIKQNTPIPNPETNIFSPKTIKKSRQLQVDGDLLMSPEPEAEKQKSVDGAGIVINIKP